MKTRAFLPIPAREIALESGVCVIGRTLSKATLPLQVLAGAMFRRTVS
jgi:hypothetical protein